MTATRFGTHTVHDGLMKFIQKPGVTSGEMQRYARDPFAHLEAEEEWTDEGGRTQVGHVFIPHVLTLEAVRLQPFPHQREFTENWIDLPRLKDTGELEFRNVHDEKSRQMGLTWWLSYLSWWLLTYHEAPGGYLNMDWGEVDNGGQASTPDSFFGKIRFIQSRIPPRFAQPLVFRGGGSAEIRNLARPMAYLVGEGATPDPGRGGTYRWWIIDEAARLRYGESAHAALSRACPNGRVYNSTPEGEGNIYFRLKETQPEGYRFVRFHWSQHPIYGEGQHIAGTDGNCDLCRGTMEGLPWTPSRAQAHRYAGKITSPWYDRAIIDLTDDQVAAELDIDYAGSLSARVYAEFNDDVHVLDDIVYDPTISVELAWDYGLDTTAVAIIQNAPDSVRQIGELEIGDATPTEVAASLRAVLGSLGMLEELLLPGWTARLFCVGDPAGEGRTLSSGKPLVYDYQREGFSIVSRPQPVSTTILATKRLLMGRPKPYRVSARTCGDTIRHWKANRFPVDRTGRRKPGAPPHDDEHNHMMRAIAYYCAYRWPVVETSDAIEDARVWAIRENSRDLGVDHGLSYDMDM